MDTIVYKKTLTSGNYMTSFNAYNPGKYVCDYQFADENGMLLSKKWNNLE